jgi:hypothetical protein
MRQRQPVDGARHMIYPTYSNVMAEVKEQTPFGRCLLRDIELSSVARDLWTTPQIQRIFARAVLLLVLTAT